MAGLVFGGGLWPIGWSIGFIELPVGEAVAAYRRWTQDWPAEPVFRSLGDRPLPELQQELLPLEMPHRKRLLVGTRGGWTALFDNSRDGRDLQTPTLLLARQEGVRCVHVRHVPAEQSAAASELHVWLPGPAGGWTRSLEVHVDQREGVERFEAGDPQPFESAVAGEGPLAARLDCAALLACLAELGLHPDDEGWYGAGMLVTAVTGWRPGWTGLIDEARQRALAERPPPQRWRPSTAS